MNNHRTGGLFLAFVSSLGRFAKGAPWLLPSVRWRLGANPNLAARPALDAGTGSTRRSATKEDAAIDESGVTSRPK